MAAALEPAVAGQRVDAVVLGTVTRVDVTGPPLAPLLQWGTIDLRTETVLRGPPSGGTVEFMLSEERHRKGHRSRPMFEVGDRVIVLLDEQPNDQWALPAELGVHGVWFIEEDRAEVRYVKVPGHDGTTLRERRVGELIDVFAED